jgi:alpha-L-rhamnosidase
MNKFLTAICLLFFFNSTLQAFSQAQVTPENLKCELLKNPAGIDVPQPDLSYVLHAKNSDARSITQTAYQIWVSSTPDFRNGGDLWDSKKVMGDQMAYLAYKGKTLVSAQKYWWKVRIWDQAGHRSSWSKIANWTMGVLNKNDWKASWISAPGAEKYALSPVGFKSADAESAAVNKWVQVDLGKASPFSEIMLYPMFYADQAGYAFPVRYKVSASDDPSFQTETIIADFTKEDFKNPRFSAVHLPVKNIAGRYVRVTATQLAQKATGYSFALRQIEVLFGGKNIAAGKPVDASDSDDDNGFSKINLTDRVSDYRNFPNYSSMLLRKYFRVKPALVRATIHISGLSAYELTINGRKIGDYLLTPGWTDYRKTVLYDTYDVTRYLKSGANAIGIMLGNSVYNIQPDTTRYVKFLTTFGPAKTVAQLKLEYTDGSTETVITDKSWKASPGPVTYSNLYGGEDFNANLEQRGWNNAGFIAGKDWVPALETSGPGGLLKGLSAAAPPIKAIDTIAPIKINKISDNVWIYDFGQNASMMPALRVTGPKGSRVRMIPSELVGKNGLVDRRSATQDGVRPAWWEYTLSGTGMNITFRNIFTREHVTCKWSYMQLKKANLCPKLFSYLM